MPDAKQAVPPSSFYVRYGKRGLDALVAGLLLAALSPLMLLVAVTVRRRLGRPVFFGQVRPGKDEALFTMFKFRTMTDMRAPDGQLLSDDVRLPPFGRLLRSTSLDELPGLWNVLRGEMSLVGPRPLLPEYLPLYSRAQSARHQVKPGITGLAQATGRNALSWEERFRLDTHYVEHVSLGIDLKILWLTVWTVIARRGVSAEGHATMPPFSGSAATSSSPASNSAETSRDLAA